MSAEGACLVAALQRALPLRPFGAALAILRAVKADTLKLQGHMLSHMSPSSTGTCESLCVAVRREVSNLLTVGEKEFELGASTFHGPTWLCEKRLIFRGLQNQPGRQVLQWVLMADFTFTIDTSDRLSVLSRSRGATSRFDSHS